MASAAAPPGSFCRKMSNTSQFSNVELRIVRPSAAHTCRHSTCAPDPSLCVKSWKRTSSIRMFVGDAVVAVPLEAIRLESSGAGPTLPPISEMSPGACAPLDKMSKAFRVLSRNVRSCAPASIHNTPAKRNRRSSRWRAEMWSVLLNVTAAPGAGSKITSSADVLAGSADTFRSS